MLEAVGWTGATMDVAAIDSQLERLTQWRANAVAERARLLARLDELSAALGRSELIADKLLEDRHRAAAARKP